MTVLLYNTVVNTAVGSASTPSCSTSACSPPWWASRRHHVERDRLLLLSFFALAPNLAPLFTDVITARQEQALALIAACIGGGSALLVDYVARVSFVHRLLLEAHGGAILLAALAPAQAPLPITPRPSRRPFAAPPAARRRVPTRRR